MKITYQLDDGYVGPSRPHYVEVDDYSLAECETPEEVENLIGEYVREHMEQRIIPHWENPEWSEIEKLKAKYNTDEDIS